MVLFMLLSIACALSHHLFYKSFDGHEIKGNRRVGCSSRNRTRVSPKDVSNSQCLNFVLSALLASLAQSPRHRERYLWYHGTPCKPNVLLQLGTCQQGFVSGHDSLSNLMVTSFRDNTSR
ncbi:hypothetical protein IQ07DRAFT_384270 [Pyrenochaeta sp. DS3sAY3a]|nr:hypothetical protein IQ07DRAFT_384270 [Pyrenochaeta sp. DS3sAY3a]